jgi:hypothetical protein
MRVALENLWSQQAARNLVIRGRNKSKISNEGRHKTTKKRTQEKQVRTTICSCLLSLCDSNSTAEGRCLLFTLRVTLFNLPDDPDARSVVPFHGPQIRSTPYTRCARGSCVRNNTQPADVILID